MKYLVGIDEGTMGCKTCVFDENGNMLSSAAREYNSYFPKPGYVEQDIEEIKNNIFASCKEAIVKANIDNKDIVGVSHSNQGITMVFLDKDEQVVRQRTIGWQDVRHTEILPEMRELISDDEYYELAGMTLGTYNIPILNWLQKNEPDVWKNVSRCCSHQDYFLRQLGADGYYIDEGCANFMSMMGTYDREWNDKLLSIYNIDKSYLPTIVHEPGTVVGKVTKEVSEQTGLPEGCLVCVGGLDTNCCGIGAGASESGTEVLIVGTAGVSILVTDQDKLDPNKRVTLRSNPGFDNWQLYIMTNTAASSFKWFRDELCSMEAAAGKLVGQNPYDLLTSMASQSKPGANGITALTCLQGSHGRRKNEDARGAFVGISLGTTKADIAQSILEGITFEMKDLLLMKEQLAKIDRVRLCGGVTASPFWCQMFADILNKPIELTEVPELGSIGAAMCAGIGAGLYSDCRDAINKCVRVAKTYIPNPDRIEAYENAFQRWNTSYEVINEGIY